MVAQGLDLVLVADLVQADAGVAVHVVVARAGACLYGVHLVAMDVHDLLVVPARPDPKGQASPTARHSRPLLLAFYLRPQARSPSGRKFSPHARHLRPV